MKKKKKVEKDTRANYYKYIKKLEALCPREEMYEISKRHTTVRKNVDWDNICRVVPADWVELPELLSMNKENNIYSELIIKDMYKLIKEKILRSRL